MFLGNCTGIIIAVILGWCQTDFVHSFSQVKTLVDCHSQWMAGLLDTEAALSDWASPAGGVGAVFGPPRQPPMAVSMKATGEIHQLLTGNPVTFVAPDSCRTPAEGCLRAGIRHWRGTTSNRTRVFNISLEDSCQKRVGKPVGKAPNQGSFFGLLG